MIEILIAILLALSPAPRAEVRATIVPYATPVPDIYPTATPEPYPAPSLQHIEATPQYRVWFPIAPGG